MISVFLDTAGAQSLMCESIYTLDVPVAQPPPVAVSTHLFVDQIRSVISAKKFGWISGKIGWHSFQDLQKLKRSFEFYLDYYYHLSPENRALEKRNLEKLIQVDPILRDGEVSYTPRPKNWRGMLIPWSYRLLLVPFILDGLKLDQFLAQIPLDKKEVDMNAPWYPIIETLHRPHFIEMQVFGKLTLDDIESFVFHRNPPAGDFLLELRKRGIKIYDGRSYSKVLWEN